MERIQMTNFIANLLSVLYSVCYVQGTQEQWRIVFFLSAGMYLIGWLGYMIAVKGYVLSWAQIDEPEITQEVINLQPEYHLQNSVSYRFKFISFYHCTMTYNLHFPLLLCRLMVSQAMTMKKWTYQKSRRHVV